MEIREIPYICTWEYGDKPNKKGKYPKKPYPVSNSDKEYSLEQAWKLHEKYPETVGIGMRLRKEYCLVRIDIDGVFEDGTKKLKPKYEWFVKQALEINLPVWITPSGNGLGILAQVSDECYNNIKAVAGDDNHDGVALMIRGYTTLPVSNEELYPGSYSTIDDFFDAELCVKGVDEYISNAYKRAEELKRQKKEEEEKIFSFFSEQDIPESQKRLMPAEEEEDRSVEDWKYAKDLFRQGLTEAEVKETMLEHPERNKKYVERLQASGQKAANEYIDTTIKKARTEVESEKLYANLDDCARRIAADPTFFTIDGWLCYVHPTLFYIVDGDEFLEKTLDKVKGVKDTPHNLKTLRHKVKAKIAKMGGRSFCLRKRATFNTTKENILDKIDHKYKLLSVEGIIQPQPKHPSEWKVMPPSTDYFFLGSWNIPKILTKEGADGEKYLAEPPLEHIQRVIDFLYYTFTPENLEDVDENYRTEFYGRTCHIGLRYFLAIAGNCLAESPSRGVVAYLVGPGGSGKSKALELIRSLLPEMEVASINLSNANGRFSLADVLRQTAAFAQEFVNTNAYQIKEAFKSMTSGDIIATEVKYVQGLTDLKSRVQLFIAANGYPLWWDKAADDRCCFIETFGDYRTGKNGGNPNAVQEFLSNPENRYALFWLLCEHYYLLETGQIVLRTGKYWERTADDELEDLDPLTRAKTRLQELYVPGGGQKKVSTIRNKMNHGTRHNYDTELVLKAIKDVWGREPKDGNTKISVTERNSNDNGNVLIVD